MKEILLHLLFPSNISKIEDQNKIKSENEEKLQLTNTKNSKLASFFSYQTNWNCT